MLQTMMAEIAFTNADDDIVRFCTDPSAMITNTSISVVFGGKVLELNSSINIQFCCRLFVPIPIFPLESILIASLLFVFMIKGLPSTVPKKIRSRCAAVSI